MNDHRGWSCPDCTTTNGQLHRWCIVCGGLRPEHAPHTAGVLGPRAATPTRGRELAVAILVLSTLVVIGAGAWLVAATGPEADGPTEALPPAAAVPPADRSRKAIGDRGGAVREPAGGEDPVVAWAYPSSRYAEVVAVAAKVSGDGFRSGTVVSHEPTPSTTAIYLDGAGSEMGRLVAAAIGLPDAPVLRAPADLTARIDDGDIIVVLGADWIALQEPDRSDRAPIGGG